MDRDYLKKICDVGAAMIENGAEISRAEDSLRRMMSSLGVEGNAFCLNSLVVLLCEDEVLVRRINKNDLNLGEIDRLNTVSRDICKMKSIYRGENKYSLLYRIFSVFLATGAFCVYFGGSITDALVSGIIGLIILAMPKFNVGTFAYTLLQSTVAGFLSYAPRLFGLAVSPDKIMIGTVMLLIPGITIGNAIRDIMYCDTLSGVIEFTESVFTALAIAFGFSLAVIF